MDHSFEELRKEISERSTFCFHFSLWRFEFRVEAKCKEIELRHSWMLEFSGLNVYDDWLVCYIC
jgi:hypothetical protein